MAERPELSNCYATPAVCGNLGGISYEVSEDPDGNTELLIRTENGQTVEFSLQRGLFDEMFIAWMRLQGILSIAAQHNPGGTTIDVRCHEGPRTWLNAKKT